MAVSSKEAELEIVRSHLRGGERVLWWYGDYEFGETDQRMSDRISPWTKALAIVPILFLLVFRSDLAFWVQGLFLLSSFGLASWQYVHAWRNRVWKPHTIITDQRVWFPYITVKGSDIVEVERGFGFNGAVTHDLITKAGTRVSLPVTDIETTRDLIKKHFITPRSEGHA